MEFELTGKYKSLTDFKTPYLDNFTVITGLNGSGKSQFLELIHLLQNRLSYTSSSHGDKHSLKLISSELGPSEVLYIPYDSLKPRNLGSMDKASYTQIKMDLANAVAGVNKNVNFGDQTNNILKNIANSINKDYSELNEKDVFDYNLTHEDLGIKNIFRVELGKLFYNYAYNREQNNYKNYKNSRGGNYNSLTDVEFNKFFHNPWQLINSFLDKMKSDYYVEGIKEEDFHENMTIKPEFINKITNEKVPVHMLSSGEQVIVSLAICLFNIELGKSHKFPKILLLDEPDAPLHPSMTKDFLDVIYDEIVIKKGIKVIMTTHSPSTVALSDEKYLFCMSNTGERFEKISKDKALKLLTKGLNTISIDHENRRQVFVESPYDVKIYEKFYRLLSEKLIPEISITFISSGESFIGGKGIKIANCGQVINITNILRDAGNKRIWGIIDYDSKNDPKDFEYVKVLGDGKRYAIENYIFDPVILGALLLREKILKKSDLGLTKEKNFTDLEDFDSASLQMFANKVLALIKPKAKNSDKSALIKAKYLNNTEIELPEWFTTHQGHDLETVILEIFPKLNSLSKGKREQLKIEIIEKVIDDIPGCIPIDILETLQFVQG